MSHQPPIPERHAAELIKDGQPYRSCCGTTLDMPHIPECVHYQAVPRPDLVNHPPHYTSHASGVESIEFVRHMTFDVGNATKYVERYLLKGNPRQDLEKAMWYLNDAIAADDPIWINANHLEQARPFLEKVMAHEEGLRRQFFESLLELDIDECLAITSELLQLVDA